MQTILITAAVLLVMFGLAGMVITGGGQWFRKLMGVVGILLLIALFSDLLIACLGPVMAKLITWVVRITAVIAALIGIILVIRALRNR